jgi:DeoR/GlpR family transcriptional regulator of sugar metabolism
MFETLSLRVRKKGDETLTVPGQKDQSRIDRQRQRQRDIAEMVIAEGTVRIEDIVDHFGVSAMTIRRDLETLDAQSVLRRTRGQATALASSLFEANTFFRQTQSIESKNALAHAALELIGPGTTVMLDDSTTGIYLARLLPQRAPLTVVTNFLSVANELLKEPGITLNILGGQYYAWCDALLGGTTVDAIRRVRVDTLIMSTSAIIDYTCFHHAQETHLIKRAMFDSAAERILYVDHTKFKRRALIGLAPLTDFDAVIVDSLTPPEHLDYLRDHGTRVVVASDRWRRLSVSPTQMEL